MPPKRRNGETTFHPIAQQVKAPETVVTGIAYSHPSNDWKYGQISADKAWREEQFTRPSNFVLHKLGERDLFGKRALVFLWEGKLWAQTQQ